MKEKTDNFANTIAVTLNIPMALYPAIKNYQRHLLDNEPGTTWPIQSVVYRLVKEAIFNNEDIQAIIKARFNEFKNQSKEVIK